MYQVKKALNDNKINPEYDKVIDILFVDQNTFGNNQYLLSQDLNKP